MLDADRTDRGAGLEYTDEAQPTFGQRGFFTGLRWTGRFGDALTAHAQVAHDSFRTDSRSCREWHW